MMTSNKTAEQMIEMSVAAHEIVAQEYSADVEADLRRLSTEDAPGPAGSRKYVGTRDGVVWQVILLRE